SRRVSDGQGVEVAQRTVEECGVVAVRRRLTIDRTVRTVFARACACRTWHVCRARGAGSEADRAAAALDARAGWARGHARLRPGLRRAGTLARRDAAARAAPPGRAACGAAADQPVRHELRRAARRGGHRRERVRLSGPRLAVLRRDSLARLPARAGRVSAAGVLGGAGECRGGRRAGEARPEAARRRMTGPRHIGAIVVAAMLALAIVGPWLAPYAPDSWVGPPLRPPSRGHWLGTDDMGQDLWSAWLYGARHSVVIAVL